ncbi:MAG TPA: hypothetical protein VN857_16620 [Chthoniobacterales bacterium]|nr:hypothetical protein [Chthoniobacterales bacterium]
MTVRVLPRIRSADEIALLLKTDRKQEMVSLIEKEESEFPEPSAHDILKFYEFQ